MRQIYFRAVSLRASILVFFTIAVLIAPVCLSAQEDTTRHVADSSSIQQSNSALKSKVVYNARDSVRFDVADQKMYLYGEGVVIYENMELKADYIEFDMTKNIAFSRGKRDSTGKAVLDSIGLPIGDPVFADGGKSFDAKELTYNFETKKGKIREVTTQEGEAYIHARDAKKDTGDVYYIKNGKYTTCDHENPHFYLQATKIKIIPKDKIICGPAYLVIADVPTPLALPFGVFPNKVGRKSGVLIPAYGESAALGFFLTDGGYYFGLSDYFDLALRGDVYSLGSYNLRANTNYNKRYKFNGNVGLRFGQIQFSEKEFPDYRKDRSFWLTWQHAQDMKLNPTSRFSANVNAGSNSYQTYLSNNANDYLSNSFMSNILWNKSWQGRPYNLSVSMAHSQTSRPRADKKGEETVVDLTVPEIAFTRNRWYPFQGKNYSGRPNVFQKIGASYSINGKNQVTTGDSILLNPETLDKLRNGLSASVPIGTSMNIGPVIIAPSVNYRGYGYFQSYHKRYDKLNDSLITDTIQGMQYAYDYSASVAANTKLYGMYAFKKGRLKAVRHVMTPGTSFSYRPDFGEKKYRYYDSVQKDTTGIMQQYSFFENSVYGYPGAGKSGFITFSVDNNLEMKLRPSKKDTAGTDRKIMLIENFGISSSCNIAAEQFQWSNVNLYARTRLFKVVDVNIGGTLDPYAYDTTLGRRIDRFQYNVNGRIGRLTSANFALNTSLRSLAKKTDDKTKTPARRLPPGYADELAYIQSHPEYYVDFNVPWDLMLNYNLNYSNTYILKKQVDTVIQSLSFSGSVSVTKKWKVGFRSGFDFVRKDFTYTSFDVYRDLHCWEMRLNWIPFGLRKSYMLTIAVKASSLQDLKLNRTRNWYDAN